MNINVPESALAHFWEDPPNGSWEFWSFRFRPPCTIGDEIVFRYRNIPIATAIVAKIEPPGKSKCAGTGRFFLGWKVFWMPKTFCRVPKKARQTTKHPKPEPVRGKVSGCLRDSSRYRLAVCWCEKCLPKNIAEIRRANMAEYLAREIKESEEE